MRLAAEPGIAALRAAILDVLRATEMNKVWVGSWDGALVDPERRAGERARYRRWRSHLRPLVVAAQERGELRAGDPDDMVAIVAAFTHGLVVQSLFDPRAFSRARQESLADAFLEGLTPARR